MVLLGIDPPKDTHTVVVVDQAGRPLGQTTVAARTRTTNRLRWHLHQLGPDLQRATRRLAGPGLRRLAAWLAQATRASRSASAAARSPRSARSPTRSANGPSTPPAGRPAGPSLLSLPGCGPLTAAKLMAETAGVAPVPVRSGRTDRHRLSRGGNRQLNAAMHRIAITQLGLPGPGQPTTGGAGPRVMGPVRPSPPSSAASPAPSTSDSELPNPEPTPSTPPLDRGAT